MAGRTIKLRKKRPEWVSSLVESKFFGGCEDHREFRKNEKNMMCIDCNTSLCKHCLASPPHSLHRCLQICKYVYQDVVRLQDIQKYLDPSKIQTYKINGEKAIHLNPRPQIKDAKSSRSKIALGCEVCGKHIQDSPHRFCSIACKFPADAEESERENEVSSLEEMEHVNRKINTNTNEGEPSSSHSLKEESCVSASESSKSIQTGITNSFLKPNKNSIKRKGVPRRSPLF